MADLGIRSRDAPSDVVVLVGTSLERMPVGARKAAGGEETVGRRVGREEKDLDCVSYEAWRQRSAGVNHLVEAARVVGAAHLVARRQLIVEPVAPKSEKRN